MSASDKAKTRLEVATDLTSWYGFLAYLTGDLKTSWARDNYLDVTVLTLIRADIRTPLPPADAKGPAYDLDPLRKYFPSVTDPGSERDTALAYQAEWLRDPARAEALRDFLDELLRDECSGPWVSWHIAREWPEHIRRCGGLVEKGYEDLVSILVPEMTAQDIKDINDRALDDPDCFAHGADDTDRRLFTADVMRRGVYYRRVNELLGRQQVVHQTRRIPASAANEVDQHVLVQGFEPFVLAELIRMHTAGVETGRDKVDEWKRTVDRVSRAFLQGRDELVPADFEANEEALQSAGRRAGKLAYDLKLSTGSPEVHKAVRLVGVGIGGAVGAGVGLILDRFLGTGNAMTVAGGAIGAAAAQAVGDAIDKRVTRTIEDPRRAARTLASAGPGFVRSSLALRAPTESEAPPSIQHEPSGPRSRDSS